MPDLANVLAVYGAFIIGLISPGPDFFLITGMALVRGSRAALLAAIGISVGVGVWVLAAAVGLGAAITEAPIIWEAIRFCGGGMLIYMGGRSLSAGIRNDSGWAADGGYSSSASPLILGLATNLANPKAAVVLVGMTAVMAEDVSEAGLLILIVLGMPAITLAWFSLLATTFAQSAFRDRLLRQQRKLSIAVGAAFFGIGILLIQNVGT